MATLTHGTLTEFHLKPTGLIARIAETAHVWRRRARERRALAELSQYDLHDMGASQSDVFTELHKPFWRE